MSFLTTIVVTRAVSPLRIDTPKSRNRLEYSFQSIGVLLSNRSSTPFWLPGISIFSDTCFPVKYDSIEVSPLCARAEPTAKTKINKTTRCAREYMCLVPFCDQNYSSDGSLSQRFKGWRE